MRMGRKGDGDYVAVDGNVAVGRRLFLYNTVCEIRLYEYEGDARWLLDRCEELSVGVQKMLNIYDEGSELSVLNRSYVPEVPYQLSKELFRLLKEVYDFSVLSEGAFDMTVGSLVRLWNFTADRPAIPEPEQLEMIRAKSGYQNLLFDEDETTLTVLVSGITIDGGGFGKGYAVGVVVDFLRNHGVTSAVINYGGNLFLIGEHPIGRGQKQRWRIGVQSPWCPRGESLGTLKLADAGVATSAGYDRYFKMGEKVWHHIINPVTGYPVESSLQSISIVSDVPLITDLMSTACFVMGIEKGEAVAGKLRNSMKLEYVAVTCDGIGVSRGMSEAFEWTEKRKGRNHYDRHH